jgi:hypothetical protein
MNRLAIFLVLSFGFIGIASAASAFRYIAPSQVNPKVVAGEVNSDGSVIRGSGFTVAHPRSGTYRLTFDTNQFICPVIVVSSETGPSSASVDKSSCRKPFHVLIWDPIDNRFEDGRFRFIATDTEQ